MASLSALRSKANETRETQDGDENKWAEEREFARLNIRYNDVVLLILQIVLNPYVSSCLIVKFTR